MQRRRGVCRQGLRKTHERADPACRCHGSDARGNEAVVRGGAPEVQAKQLPGERAAVRCPPAQDTYLLSR